LAKLKYHTGPIDQHALSSKSPIDLLSYVSDVLKKSGFVVLNTHDLYKLRIVRAADLSIDNNTNDGSVHSGLGVPESLASKDNRNKSNRFANMITSFPLSLVKRLKYIAQFGTQYNSGFDTHTDQKSFNNSKLVIQKEIVFTVQIQRIRNLDGLLIVQVNRLRGDIWQFKKMYYDIVAALAPL
jgi:protein-serine/threonine kinase